MKKECRVIPIEPIFIYIISDDDEIMEGDWYHNLDMRSKEFGIIKADKRLAELANNAPSCKKIIASNDPELNVVDVETGVCGPGGEKEIIKELNVPFIPESFIKEYCKQNGIDKVWVDYEDYDVEKSGFNNDRRHNHLDGMFPRKLIVTNLNEIIIHTTNDSTFDPNSKGRETFLPKSLLLEEIQREIDVHNKKGISVTTKYFMAGLDTAKRLIEKFKITDCDL